MENEMKPDTLLGNKPDIGEDGFPVLTFTVPDMMMKEIKAYNDSVEKDGRKLMVRGHVLVWHSQTPEWFFHEEYNVDKPYVDQQTMLARMENYIRQVMEHYEGGGQPVSGHDLRVGRGERGGERHRRRYAHRFFLVPGF